jgi:signal transduction histidine kinase
MVAVVTAGAALTHIAGAGLPGLPVAITLVCFTFTVGSAYLIGRGLAAASNALRLSTRHIGDPDRFTPPPSRLPTELGHIADEINQTHNRITELRGNEAAMYASRRQHIALASDELRITLTRLRVLAEALDHADAETTRGYYSLILTETHRLTRTVDDLFELARIGVCRRDS